LEALADSLCNSNSTSSSSGSHDGLSSIGHISESRNGHNLEIEIVGFNREQFTAELAQIKQTIFDETVAEGVSEPEAVEIAEIQAEEAAQ
jgi:hypothetical protein